MKYKTTRSPLDANIPLALLINGFSASSSEIVAGALQDLDRAVVVGQRSFGKGVVQNVRPLPYGEKFKLTTAKYYTPSGRCVQAIDYAHRNPDGSADKIPDSLVQKFSTRAGRTVYDGGGISPDEKLAPQAPPQILAMLYAKNLFFDFANLYYAQHETIASIAEFSLQPSDFQNFVTFAKDSGFTYETTSSKALQDLIKTLKKEKYYDDLKPELDDLTAKLAPNIPQDFERFKKEISEMLEEEIVSRYYYQHGRLEVSTRHDTEVKRAAEILQDNALYNSFLQPQR
jgi:carboxyl-terminal processing protease